MIHVLPTLLHASLPSTCHILFATLSSIILSGPMAPVGSFPVGIQMHKTALVSEIRSLYMHGNVSKTHITCFRCGQNGHYKLMCMHHKTQLCVHFRQGVCTKAGCPFAHGVEELRNPSFLRHARFGRWHHANQSHIQSSRCLVWEKKLYVASVATLQLVMHQFSPSLLLYHMIDTN